MKVINSLEINERKKRVSKKNKKSWRKHTKVQDVEDFLEEQRLEERLGCAFQKLEDDLLFEIDKTPREVSLENDSDTGFEDDEDVKPKKERKQISRKEWRNKLLSKPINAYKILEPDSKVPDPIIKRNRVRTKEERQHPITIQKEIERKQKGLLKKKEKEALVTREVNKKRKENEPKKGTFLKDLWSKEKEETFLDKSNADLNWLDKETILHTKKNTGLFKKKKDVKSLEKPYIIEAVEPPHPGMSYNPSFKDHQKLLSEITESEQKLIKEEEHLTRVTTKMFKKITPHQQQKLWLEEMSQGLSVEDNNDNDNNKLDDNTSISVNPPALNKKKDLKKRRHIKEERQKKLERKKEKVEKKKIADLYRIKFINKDFDKMDKQINMLREKREKIKKYKSKEAKQLSKMKFKPLDLDFNMPDELKGSLRLMKQEGNLLKDRFNSLQKRNIIETRKRQRVTKAKVKKFIKKSHRDPEEEQQQKKKKK